MKVVETFSTLQGEGKYLGVPSYFIRTTGCNLRCAWKNKDDSVTICDTPYTSFKPEKGYRLDVESVLEKLTNKSIYDIVITGGEPTIQRDLSTIVNEFINEGYRVTIETNGTKYHKSIESAFISLSPKLKSSYAQTNKREKRLHEKNNQFLGTTKNWVESDNDYQLKFVVNDESDINEIRDIQKKLQSPSHKIYLMPQGITQEQFQEKQQWMFNQCVKYGFNYTPRMHIDIFGNVRGI